MKNTNDIPGTVPGTVSGTVPSEEEIIIFVYYH